MYEIIDLHFQGFPHVIASYVLRGPAGVAVIETGPASTYPALKAGLASLGIELTQVTDVLVTHVHLDHAGAAGELSYKCAHGQRGGFGDKHHVVLVVGDGGVHQGDALGEFHRDLAVAHDVGEIRQVVLADIAVSDPTGFTQIVKQTVGATA